jgi:hypothetical protein
LFFSANWRFFLPSPAEALDPFSARLPERIYRLSRALTRICRPSVRELDEHQFDALISASAPRQGRAREWRDVCAQHCADMIFPAGPVSYLLPKNE